MLGKFIDYYEILEISPNANSETIERIFRHLAMRFHPDNQDHKGRKFDSSVDRGEPATFPLSRVIQGWQEALPMMKIGDKWRIVLPPHLAYGEQGAGGVIGPNATLVFEVELKDIVKE